MTKIIHFCSALSLLLAGCTTDIGPAARKAGVNSIKVERHVDVDQPMRIGFKSDTGNLSAAVAGIIVNGMYAQRLTRFGVEMRENDIDVPAMVRDSVIGILLKEKGFTIDTNSADATLVVAIQQYGFDGAGLSMSREVPFIALRAELTRKGERLWKGEGQAHPLRSGGLGAKTDDYHAQPELLRDHWRIQINRAVRQMLSADATEK